jgi:hypothetical protein
MNMEWRSVPGFNDYEISEYGDIRRRTFGHGCSPGPRKVTKEKSGYLCVGLYDGTGKSTTLRIHTLVANAFIGPRPSDQHEVAHRDGNRANNYRRNLRWATRAENMEDAARHGTIRRGENHSEAKLTDVIVKECRRMFANGDKTIADLANKYGISRRTMRDAICGEGWRHITDVPPVITTPETLYKNYVRGSRHSLAKLTEADVISIRQRFANGENILPIAKTMDVTRQTISGIVYRKTWKHVA